MQVIERSLWPVKPLTMPVVLAGPRSACRDEPDGVAVTGGDRGGDRLAGVVLHLWVPENSVVRR